MEAPRKLFKLKILKIVSNILVSSKKKNGPMVHCFEMRGWDNYKSSLSLKATDCPSRLACQYLFLLQKERERRQSSKPLLSANCFIWIYLQLLCFQFSLKSVCRGYYKKLFTAYAYEHLCGCQGESQATEDSTYSTESKPRHWLFKPPILWSGATNYLVEHL